MRASTPLQVPVSVPLSAFPNSAIPCPKLLMPEVIHTVLLKFRGDIPPGDIEDIFGQIRALGEKIPGILSFTGGPYSSPEGLNRGFTHGFVMRFSDEVSRDTYLPHPEHQRVVEQLLPMLEGNQGAIAFDWLDEED